MIAAKKPRIRSTTLGPREYEGKCRLTNAVVKSCAVAVFYLGLILVNAQERSGLAATGHDPSPIAICTTALDSRVEPPLYASMPKRCSSRS